MSGMDTPATTRNETISRSGPDSVAISAGSRAQRPASSARSRCSPEAVVAAGSGGKTGGGATDAPHPRVVPPPGPAAALLPRGPVSGWAAGRGTRSGRDPPEFVRLNPRVPHHAGRNVRGQPGVGKTLTQGATVGGREDPGRRKKHRMTHLRTAGASARVAEHKRRQGPGRVQRITRAPARAFRQGSACTPRRQCTCIRSASGEEWRPPPQRKWNRLQREIDPTTLRRGQGCSALMARPSLRTVNPGQGALVALVRED
jgi:hypothetical protein